MEELLRFFSLFGENFFRVLLPLLLAVGGGWVLRHRYGLEAKPLSLLGMNLLGPFLLLAHIPEGLAPHTVLLVLVLSGTLLMLLLSFLATRLFPGMSEDERRGFVLGTSLSNFGFFGLPLVRFALPQGEELAFILIAFLNIPTGIMAALIAAPDPHLPGVLKRVFSLPFVWAVMAVLLLGYTGGNLPLPLHAPFAFVGEAAVPVMLVALGIELARVPLSTFFSRAVLLGIALRLLFFPLLIASLAWLLHLDPLALKVATLQLATPAGVTSLVYFSMFGRDTRLLAALTLGSTILSFLTLPAWVSLLVP